MMMKLDDDDDDTCHLVIFEPATLRFSVPLIIRKKRPLLTVKSIEINSTSYNLSSHNISKNIVTPSTDTCS